MATVYKNTRYTGGSRTCFKGVLQPLMTKKGFEP